MKYRLTIRYFLWIAGFMIFCFILNTAFDLANDHYPIRWITSRETGEELRESTVSLILNLLAIPWVLLAAWLIARRLLSPLRQIADTAEKIGRGHLKERLAYRYPGDELGRLVATLNQAFEEYDANLERQKRFAADAAHQLRTPLAVMRNAGEICLTRPRTPEHYRESMASMLESIDRLSRTCEQLLELSRLDTPAMRSRLTPCDPGPVIQRVGREFIAVAAYRGISLRLEIADGILIEGMADLVGEVASNLLDNAIRHAPCNGLVSIHWRRSDPASAELSVEDNGPGIPEAVREVIFEPFSQGAQPRAGGAGLGLALVAEIVRLHNGSVHIDTSRLGGARVVTTWPARSA